MPSAKTRRQYSGGAVETTLSAHVSGTDVQINGLDFSTWPTGQSGNTLQPAAAVINPGGDNEEKIYYGPRNGNTLQNCQRGADGTVAQVHEAGEKIQHIFTAQDADEANSHIADDSADDHSQYVHTSIPRTVTAAHVHTAAEIHNGNEIHNGSEIFNQPVTMKGQVLFPDNPRFQGTPTFDGQAAITPSKINGATSSSQGGSSIPAGAGHIHGIDAPALAAALSSVLFAKPSWHYVGALGEPAFQNGWSAMNGKTSLNTNNSPNGEGSVRFCIDAAGWVVLEGMIAGGTLAVPAFTLPTGYVPEQRGIWPAASNAAFGFVIIPGKYSPGPGGVSPYGSSTNVQLDGIRFNVG